MITVHDGRLNFFVFCFHTTLILAGDGRKLVGT